MKNLFPLKKQLSRLAKAAQTKVEALKGTQYRHVVYGISRNSRGQLSTFFVPMTDEQLDLYVENCDDIQIYAAHI